jgi:hypothetical protein
MADIMTFRRDAQTMRPLRRCHQALKALSETDEWVDAVGCPSHAKIGPEIELPVVPEFVENTRSQYHDTARGIFIAE